MRWFFLATLVACGNSLGTVGEECDTEEDCEEDLACIDAPEAEAADMRRCLEPAG